MRILVLTRRMLRYGGGGLLAAALVAVTFFWMFRESPVSVKPQKRLPVYGVNTTEKKIALTFDCAWENSDTEILLALLEQNQVKATFFTTGDWCDRYPEDVKALAAAGHGVENHSYGHPHVASISAEKLLTDTRRCDEIIEQLTGKLPMLYRAPYGEYSDEMLEVIEDQLGKKVIQWDCEPSVRDENHGHAHALSSRTQAAE